jgi:hypothetical protein
VKAGAARATAVTAAKTNRRRDVRGRRTVTGICKWSWNWRCGRAWACVLRHGHGCCDSCHGSAIMHAPAAVTAAEQEGCKALAVRVREDGYLGRLVCGGDWQFKTLFLVGQSSNPAGKDGEEKAPPNYRQAGKQKRKKEVKKSPASGRSAQTTDSKMNLPRTPNTSHPPTHHTTPPHTRHKPARKPPITTRTAHTHPPPVWRRGRASLLRSPPVPPPNGSALARGARRATGARALAVQSCCIGPWRGGEALALREQGGAVAGVWQRWWVGGGPGSPSVSASASGQRVAGRLVVLLSLLRHGHVHGHVQRVCRCV